MASSPGLGDGKRATAGRRLLRDGVGKKEIKSPAEAGLPSWRKRRPKRDHHSLAESSRCFQIDLAYIPMFSDPKARELERSSSTQLDSFRLGASATSANGLDNAPVISAPEKGTVTKMSCEW